MINRTVQILGQGYGSTPATIALTLNGTSVFDGEVPTLNESVPSDFTSITMPILCTFEIPVNFEGTAPMSCAVTNGQVVFADIWVNYYSKSQLTISQGNLNILLSTAHTEAEKIEICSAYSIPLFSSEELAVLSSTNSWNEKQSILFAHNVYTLISSGPEEYAHINDHNEARTNVTIDGIAVSPNRLPGQDGQWWWTISLGSILAYDLNVKAGTP